jgi:hypothetical protein
MLPLQWPYVVQLTKIWPFVAGWLTKAIQNPDVTRSTILGLDVIKSTKMWPVVAERQKGAKCNQVHKIGIGCDQCDKNATSFVQVDIIGIKLSRMWTRFDQVNKMWPDMWPEQQKWLWILPIRTLLHTIHVSQVNWCFFHINRDNFDFLDS